ncbi:hypothetical protein CH333_10120 [candidate division WOR-3 bacterium JGI_Cruoil_03_44_89]|uniref:FAD-binding PCMH-type domain-containing protein n=1 Tax=candidate division WOR-3 bacterium JGI_Cruoil_03_44_89 TaxID=1973748 RepID=A0A235BNK2_UNCW3|nr:MAG: hypothetical protein CH333_10120 [candidate division WOR-3 bacterium JGI_Cruoil_03_44_89]
MRKIKNYTRPKSIEEAYEIYKKGRSIFLAGGTFIGSKRNIKLENLIDLQETKLNYIQEKDDSIHIGAMTTISDIVDAKTVASSFSGILNKAARRLASPAIRNISTIGGNIMSGVPWSDITPVLLSIDAELLLFDGETHRVKIDNFFGDSKFSNMLLLEIIIKRWGRGSYRRFSRTEVDIPQVVCALTQHNKVRAAAGAIWKFPQRIRGLETVLEKGKVSDNEVRDIVDKEVKAFSDLRGEAEFKKEIASALFIDIVEELGTIRHG